MSKFSDLTDGHLPNQSNVDTEYYTFGDHPDLPAVKGYRTNVVCSIILLLIKMVELIMGYKISICLMLQGRIEKRLVQND